MLRRIADDPATQIKLSDTDPIEEATVLLIGRGAAYPALSVALGERMGVVGALSIEAAAKHLNARDFDGIVLARVLARAWSTPSSPCSPRTSGSAISPWS